MANITGLYDTNAEAQQDFGALPTGEYLVQIIDSDLKPTKNNTGHYLELVMEVLDGPMKGRKHWENLNLDNPNSQTVEIANRAFASIREATGVANPTDSRDLHFKPMVIRIDTLPAGSTRRNGTVRDRDEANIKAYKRAEGATGGPGNVPPQSSSGTAPTAAATSASPSNAAPWQRKAAA